MRQLVWSREPSKNTVDKDPKYPIQNFHSCMKCETETENCLLPQTQFRIGQNNLIDY